MSFKKLIVSGVAAAALATGAMAAVGVTGTPADIEISANKVGDYLLFSNWYAVDGSWSTDLRVVNTYVDANNQGHSIIAKVVVREGRNSNELRDFLIYLTPGDVWSGTVEYKDGKLVVVSTDDSMIFTSAAGSIETGAQKAGGHVIDMIKQSDTDDMNSGYIEISAIAQSVAVHQAPYSKSKLYTDYKLNYVPAAWTFADNMLTGQAVIANAAEDAEYAMTYTATAFNNFTSDLSINFDAAIGVNTQLSSMTSYPTTDGICETIFGIEDALAKDASYAIHYGTATAIDESKLTATFLTKKYRYTEGETTCEIDDLFIWDGAGTLVTDYVVAHNTEMRDLQEHTTVITTDELSGDYTQTNTPTCERELCSYTVANSVGNEGYVTYDFFGVDTTIMPYDHKLMSVKTVGGSVTTNMISPAFN